MNAPAQSSTAKASATAKNGAEEGGWTFRAPRFSDLLVCPYCAGDRFARCDWCADEGVIFADDFFQPGAQQ